MRFAWPQEEQRQQEGIATARSAMWCAAPSATPVCACVVDFLSIFIILYFVAGICVTSESGVTFPYGLCVTSTACTNNGGFFGSPSTSCPVAGYVCCVRVCIFAWFYLIFVVCFVVLQNGLLHLL